MKGYRMRALKDGKRVRVVHFLGFEGYMTRWTSHCSGCTEVPEMTHPPDRGIGCDECGYTGRRRNDFFVPFGSFEDYWRAVTAPKEEGAAAHG